MAKEKEEGLREGMTVEEFIHLAEIALDDIKMRIETRGYIELELERARKQKPGSLLDMDKRDGRVFFNWKISSSEEFEF